jgi:hypothetical protein
MKLSKLNRILSYTSLLLMVYSLFCLMIINTKWYKNNWTTLDLIDTPIYILAFIHFLIYWRKYTFNAKVYFCIVVVYLGFKVLDNYILFNFKSFVFYNILILLILPITIILDNNRNR